MALALNTAFGIATEGSYTTIDAVRAQPGVSEDLSDEVIDVAIQNASAIIDALIPAGFPEQVTETRKFFDIRSWPLKLTRPFEDVTAVSIDDFAVAEGWYQVTDYGLILHRRWPYYDGFFGTYGMGPRGTIPGATVSVAATWGYAEIPSGVQRAATLMAVDNLSGGSNTGGIDISSLDPRIGSISAEAFSLSLRDPSSFVAGGSSGNGQADLLLKPYKTLVGIL
jgi:hypothetical protein